MQTRIKRYNILLARSDIESIEKTEIHDEVYLPSVFSRVTTDEYYEFSKKFDIGIDFLDGIKTDTGEMKGTLSEMQVTLVDMKESLSEINNGLGSFVIEQRGHNQRLEKILEKLVDK